MNERRSRDTLAFMAVCAVAASMLVAHSAAEPGTTGAGGPAVAHHKGAVPADPGDVPVPSPRIFDTGTSTIEPTLGIGPDGSLYVHVGRGRLPFLGVAGEVRRSVDGGISWADVSPKIDDVAVHQYSLDPYLYLDERTGRLFANDLLMPCRLTSFSDDGGSTWTSSIGACDQADHQTIFAGPPTISEPTGFPNVVYDCAINGGVAGESATTTSCDKSVDGGLTFVPTGGIPYSTADAPSDGIGTRAISGLCDGATGHGFAGDDGTVYLPRGWCGQPWLAMSNDEGLTWSRVRVAENGMRRFSNGSPDHEASVVADAEGNVYYLWVAENRLPYLAISRDHGAHFETPMMIGPPGLDEAALPAMAIGASGKIAMTYMGTTTSPGPPYPSVATCRPAAGCGPPTSYDNVKWNNYITQTTDALAADPLFLSASLNDPADPLVRGHCATQGVRCGAEYDFIDVQIAPDGTAWSVFIDACPQGGPCTGQTGPLPDPGRQYVGHLVGGPSLR